MIYKTLTLTFIIVAHLLLQVAQAAPARVDFDFEITRLNSTGDPSAIPDITSGLSIGDTASGFFTIDLTQSAQTGQFNSGLFVLSDPSLLLPAGNAFGFKPETGFTVTSGGSLTQHSAFQIYSMYQSFNKVSVAPALGAQDFAQQAQFSFQGAVIVNSLVLDPGEIESYLLASTLNYSFKQYEYVQFFDGGNFLRFPKNSRDFGAQITAVSVSTPATPALGAAPISAVPLPTAAPLLMSAFGLLAMLKRRRNRVSTAFNCNRPSSALQ